MAEYPAQLIAGAVHATRGPCAWAAVAVWDTSTSAVAAHAVARENLAVPYRPGRLAYAVSPALSAALLHLPHDMDLAALIVHGHGIAHPRGFGLACHVGMMHQLTTVGVAEKLLVGQHAPVPPRRGAWSPVTHDGAVVGAALRTRPEAKILYVSPGWACGLRQAIDIVMAAIGRYRWPEPIRAARMRLKPAIRRRLEYHKPRWRHKLGHSHDRGLASPPADTWG